MIPDILLAEYRASYECLEAVTTSLLDNMTAISFLNNTRPSSLRFHLLEIVV